MSPGKKRELGLEAQQNSIKTFSRGQYDLIGSHTEIESRKKNDRLQLSLALALCKREKAILLIAKLDRLARNVHFITGLMESKVCFKAVDMPEANDLKIHIMAAFAKHEWKMISERTVAPWLLLSEGVKLGNLKHCTNQSYKSRGTLDGPNTNFIVISPRRYKHTGNSASIESFANAGFPYYPAKSNLCSLLILVRTPICYSPHLYNHLKGQFNPFLVADIIITQPRDGVHDAPFR
jgi:hypothetical protein